MEGSLFRLHLSTAEIESRIADVLGSPRDQGTLKMIVCRPKVNSRESVQSGTLEMERGLVGDNWLKRGSRWRKGGDPKRQITVMNWRFAKLVATGEQRIPLAGDQFFVDLDLGVENVPPGTRIVVGSEAVIEVTAPPHLGCKKFVERFGIDAMTFANSEFGRMHNLRGINAKVIVGGGIAVGDSVSLVTRISPTA
jgi:MOSC domain-containing protein YiiM